MNVFEVLEKDGTLQGVISICAIVDITRTPDGKGTVVRELGGFTSTLARIPIEAVAKAMRDAE